MSKSKNDNIMQFSTQSNTRGGKIMVDSSDSEDNEEQSENDNLKKTVFVDWGKPNSNSSTKKLQPISFNDLENQTKEEKKNEKKVQETPPPQESTIKHVASVNSIHYPQHKTEFYMKDEDDYNNSYNYGNSYGNNYGNNYSSHRSHSRRNQFYDNTDDNNDRGYNYRNDNDSYQQQPTKFAFVQKQQVSQPQPQLQQPPQSQQPPQHSFYKTQPPPRSQPNIQSHHREAPQIKFFGGKEQPDPTLNQQEFRPQPRQHEFRPQQRQQDFRPNQQQKPTSFNFNQQKQPKPNIHTFQPDPK